MSNRYIFYYYYYSPQLEKLRSTILKTPVLEKYAKMAEVRKQPPSVQPLCCHA
jgi:hypothetical protein